MELSNIVIDHFEQRQHQMTQDRFIKQVNDHYEWLETCVKSDSIENQRLK